jgi:hypothetical protein
MLLWACNKSKAIGVCVLRGISPCLVLVVLRSSVAQSGTALSRAVSVAALEIVLIHTLELCTMVLFV